MNRKYEAQVLNTGRNFAFQSNELNSIDIQLLPDGKIHLIKEGINYLCEILESSPDGKKVTLNANGKTFSIQIKDELDILISSMGMKLTEKKVSNNIVAPMPGLILDIKVTEGQKVGQGTEILILEAMKMENALKSLGDGQVKQILVTSGQSVEKGQILVIIE